MMSWYMNASKYKMIMIYIICWIIAVLVLIRHMSFEFVHIYLPVIYPIILYIFLTLHSTHPYIEYLYEIRKKYSWIILREWLQINIISDIKVITIACLHIIAITVVSIDIHMLTVLILSISTLYIFKMFNILIHSTFYKIMGFIIGYVSHYFLLDLFFYQDYYFLFNPDLNILSICYIYGMSYMFQVIHFFVLEKQAS